MATSFSEIGSALEGNNVERTAFAHKKGDLGDGYDFILSAISRQSLPELLGL
jgi:hypothetical protein